MKRIFIYLAPLVLFASCAKSLDDYNVDQKNPAEVSQAPLFSNALKELSDDITSPSVNINVFRFWIQQWTATTYQDEPQYDFITRNIPQGFWEPLYQEVLQDLKQAKTYTSDDAEIEDDQRNNQLAAIEIVSVYTWTALVNTWGDVPYLEALSDIGQPKYDDAATIYDDLLKRLDTAIDLINVDADGFGNADLLYRGNMAAWLKFAHSLKLKLAITLSDVDESRAREIISSSAAAAFTSNADNAAFAYVSASPNNNPVSNNLNPQFTSRQDYVGGSPFIDLLNQLEDPRRPFYFTTVGGVYVGGGIGLNNQASTTSRPSEKVIAPDFEALLLDYSEVEFILAEAAARWGIEGSPSDHYSKAIEASISYWGGDDRDVATYLAQPAVAYASAAGDWKEKIGTQKWLALYNRGFDAWVEWRRLDYPILEPAADAVAPGVIPNRLTYPRSERTLNESNVNEASSKLGEDDVIHKVFWDVN